MAQNEMKAKAGLPERVRLNEGLARSLLAWTQRWAVVRQERPTKDMIAMYSLERWTRTFFVCLCLWSGSPFSMQQPGAADSREWADGVVSVFAASGGFSSLSMRGCASTKPPDAEGGVMAAREPTKPTRNSEHWAFLRRPCLEGWSRPEGILCALTFELSRAWRQGA